MNDSNELFGKLICRYTRQQAIEDGVLVDISNMPEAREAGFRFPVALTQSVWGRYVEVPEGVIGQDVKGRLWDVLYMLRIAIQRSNGQSDLIGFKLHVREDNSPGMPPLVTLKAVCGPGDQGEPVITVMLPEED